MIPNRQPPGCTRTDNAQYGRVASLPAAGRRTAGRAARTLAAGAGLLPEGRIDVARDGRVGRRQVAVFHHQVEHRLDAAGVDLGLAWHDLQLLDVQLVGEPRVALLGLRLFHQDANGRVLVGGVVEPAGAADQPAQVADRARLVLARPVAVHRDAAEGVGLQVVRAERQPREALVDDLEVLRLAEQPGVDAAG